jgi:paraquat-inducible protein B
MTGIESEHPEIPTIRSDIQELLARMRQWLENINDNVDIDALAEGFTNALTGFAALTTSPDLQETLAGLNSFVNDEEVQNLGASLTTAFNDISAAATEATELFRSTGGELETISSELVPVLDQLGEALSSAEGTLDAARLQLRGDSAQVYQLQSTLKEVERAAVALNEFFDYLERNPESLIRGKRE